MAMLSMLARYSPYAVSLRWLSSLAMLAGYGWWEAMISMLALFLYWMIMLAMLVILDILLAMHFYLFCLLAMKAGYVGDYPVPIWWLDKLLFSGCYSRYGGKRCWLQ
jgi:hypothetical protein